MEKIKPEVIGIKRVFTGGDVSKHTFPLSRLVALLRNKADVAIHPNGKPKFRLVYKKD